MPIRSIGSGAISFGLVSIPVNLYVAASSESPSFNLLHAKCGSRIKQQRFCPVCKEVVEREELVKGYEFTKNQYVKIADDELKALEGAASDAIEISEFVPLSKVDPIYFERSYYLGPDKGGEKAYRLLTDAMVQVGKVAVAKFVLRGKENLVIIRPVQKGLVMHTMYFSNELRSFDEIGKGESVQITAPETKLAIRLIDELSNDTFEPEKYEDEYTARVLDFVKKKAEGEEITVSPTPPQRGKVIDLLDALKKSLGSVPKERRPAIQAKLSDTARPRKKAQSTKK
jgi:DNA end-binding protein Ku